jgi:hypothetical protein
LPKRQFFCGGKHIVVNVKGRAHKQNAKASDAAIKGRSCAVGSPHRSTEGILSLLR